MSLYQTIFTRRAVRKYDMNPLSDGELKDIAEYIKNTKPLAGACFNTKIVSGSAVKNNKAPHYILCFCDKSIKQLINIGYVLQKTDLYLQSKGLGSIWLGIPKPKGGVPNDYCIMLGFGRTSVPQRTSTEQFDRLALSEVSNAQNAVAEAGRLAPSATNSQPWKFVFEDGKVSINYFGRGILKAILRRKFSPIDIGIAARHIELALEENGKTVISMMSVTDGNSFGVEIRWDDKESCDAV